MGTVPVRIPTEPVRLCREPGGLEVTAFVVQSFRIYADDSHKNGIAARRHDAGGRPESWYWRATLPSPRVETVRRNR